MHSKPQLLVLDNSGGNQWARKPHRDQSHLTAIDGL